MSGLVSVVARLSAARSRVYTCRWPDLRYIGFFMARYHERPHRLPYAAYRGRKFVSFTACVENRRSLFADSEVVDAFVKLLTESVFPCGCAVAIYCFMPDHLHVIICGLEDDSRPKEAMNDFKYATGLWLAKNRPGYSWQKDYHDHIIRANDDWRRHVIYIFMNPVRAGMVEDGFDYPFTGSIGFDFQKIVTDE